MRKILYPCLRELYRRARGYTVLLCYQIAMMRAREHALSEARGNANCFRRIISRFGVYTGNFSFIDTLLTVRIYKTDKDSTRSKEKT